MATNVKSQQCNYLHHCGRPLTSGFLPRRSLIPSDWLAHDLEAALQHHCSRADGPFEIGFEFNYKVRLRVRPGQRFIPSNNLTLIGG